MLQQDMPDDYVLATGRKHTVRELVTRAFAETGVTIAWESEGASEKGRDAANGRLLVEIDPRYFRPTEVDLLLGDPSKARRVLGWEAQTPFEEMIAEMVRSDLEIVRQESALRRPSEEPQNLAAQ